MTINRNAVRAALATAIAPYMTSAKIIYDHYPAQVEKDPAVMLLASGTGRESVSVAGPGADFFIDVHNLVTYASVGDSWTEEDAEDMLGTLEYELATFMDADGTRKQAGLWSGIYYASPSLIGRITIGGVTYQDEIITLRLAKP